MSIPNCVPHESFKYCHDKQLKQILINLWNHIFLGFPAIVSDFLTSYISNVQIGNQITVSSSYPENGANHLNTVQIPW